jgi:hypothetical protein
MGPASTSEENSTYQSQYFEEHGLNLVVESLRQDMMADHVNAVVERQRPFKVFIALLDKWEIGGPLSRALALDAFRAFRVVLKPEDTQDEVSHLIQLWPAPRALKSCISSLIFFFFFFSIPNY